MRYSWKYSDSRFSSTELLKLLSFRMDSILSFLREGRYNYITNIDSKGKEEN